MIGILAAAAEYTQFCFDCPSPDAGINFEIYFVWAVGSIIFAVPSFFAGMVLHRIATSLDLWVCLLLVAVSAPLVWFVWYFVLDFSLTTPSFQQSVLSAVNRIEFVLPLVAGASIVASVASYLDGRNVRKQRAVHRYSEL